MAAWVTGGRQSSAQKARSRSDGMWPRPPGHALIRNSGRLGWLGWEAERLADYLRSVDGYWASVFSSSLDELWRSGIVVTPHGERLSGYDGVFLFQRGQACRISAPPTLVELLRGKLEALDVNEVFSERTFVHLLGNRVDDVIGPNWYGYVDSLRFRSRSGRDCRRVSECDTSALMSLRASCGETEWAEAAFNLESPAIFGCFDRVGELVAASNLTGWRTATDLVGVVTHPRRRGRGYGAAVASMATAAALEDTAVVAWRARGTNIASVHIALRLGFEHYGKNLAIRIR